MNAAVLVETELDSAAILEALHRIEARFARERLRRWGARTLDLDLLAHGDEIRPDAATQAAWMALAPERQQSEAPGELTLPHPRLQDRGFVLIPLAEIAPGWRHPVTGRSVAEMAAALPDREKAEICPI